MFSILGSPGMFIVDVIRLAIATCCVNPGPLSILSFKSVLKDYGYFDLKP